MNKDRSKVLTEGESSEKQFLKDSILYYYESKTGFEAHKNNFENIKSEFESDMELLYDKYANDNNEMRINTSDKYTGVTGLKVKKVQPVTTEINYEKFRHACKDSEVRKKCIRSTYKVTDILGLLSYLKEQGIRYKDVKKYLKREHTVDEQTVENLVEIGELEGEVVRESTLVRLKKPYYRITPIKTNALKRAVEV